MKKQKNKLNPIKALKQIIDLLPNQYRIMLSILFFGMMLKAIFETGTMLLIALFATAIAKPEELINSKSILFIEELLGFEFLSTAQGIIISFSILVGIIVILKNLYKSYLTFLVGRYSAKLEAFIGKTLISGFLTLPYEWHISQNSADLIYSIEMRKEAGRVFLNCIIKICSDYLLVSIMLVGLLLMQPIISMMVFLILGGSSFLIYTKLRRHIDNTASKCRRFEEKINKDCTKSIHGIKDVKIFAQEQTFINESEKNLTSFAWHFGKYKFFEQSPAAILESIGFIMLTGSVCLMLSVLKSSQMDIMATITLLAVAAWKCLPAMQRILQATSQIRYSLPFVNKVLEYLNMIQDHNTLTQTTNSKPATASFNHELILKNIYFKYAKLDINVLQNINITIKKGETIGIIGTSGAGKSTLVDILTGLLQPSKGQIKVDNTHLNSDNCKNWRKLIGYVSQSPYIYDGTIAENIAFGFKESNIDRNRVKKCCQMAYMDNFLCDLPKGIDTEIGERGIRLSGGQRQRVAIARALYKNPVLMIFDEATSSLDSNSEKEIKKTIYSLSQEKTLIIIAHRLTTVEDCDRIFWIEKGQIKKCGTATEILPLYKKILEKSEDKTDSTQKQI